MSVKQLTAFEVIERYVDAKIRLERETHEVGEDEQTGRGGILTHQELAEASAHLKALFDGRGLIVTSRNVSRFNDEDLT